MVICKTTISRCFQNNAQPKETMLSPGQPIELDFFFIIDQSDWNQKPICEISKVCVNLIPNLKYHNPESWTHNSRFFWPKVGQIICDCVCDCDCSSNVN